MHHQEERALASTNLAPQDKENAHDAKQSGLNHGTLANPQLHLPTFVDVTTGTLADQPTGEAFVGLLVHLPEHESAGSVALPPCQHIHRSFDGTHVTEVRSPAQLPGPQCRRDESKLLLSSNALDGSRWLTAFELRFEAMPEAPRHQLFFLIFFVAVDGLGPLPFERGATIIVLAA